MELNNILPEETIKIIKNILYLLYYKENCDIISRVLKENNRYFIEWSIFGSFLSLDGENKNINDIKLCMKMRKSFVLIKDISKIYWYKNNICSITFENVFVNIYCSRVEKITSYTGTRTYSFEYLNIKNKEEYTLYLNKLLLKGKMKGEQESFQIKDKINSI
jgi:hypothetical protein